MFRIISLTIVCFLAASWADAHDIRALADQPPRDENGDPYTDSRIRAGIGVRLNQGALDFITKRAAERLGRWEFHRFPPETNLGVSYIGDVIEHPGSGEEIAFDNYIRNNTLKGVVLSALLSDSKTSLQFATPSTVQLAFHSASPALTGYMRLWHRIEEQTLMLFSRNYEEAVRPEILSRLNAATPDNTEYDFAGTDLKLEAEFEVIGRDQWLDADDWKIQDLRVEQISFPETEQYTARLGEGTGIARAFGMSRCQTPEDCLQTYMNVFFKTSAARVAEPLLNELRYHWNHVSVLIEDTACTGSAIAVHTQPYEVYAAAGSMVSIFHGVYTSCPAPQRKLTEFISLDHQLVELTEFAVTDGADADVFIPLGNMKRYLAALLYGQAEETPAEDFVIENPGPRSLRLMLPGAGRQEVIELGLQLKGRTIQMTSMDHPLLPEEMPLLQVFPALDENVLQLGEAEITGGYLRAPIFFRE